MGNNNNNNNNVKMILNRRRLEGDKKRVGRRVRKMDLFYGCPEKIGSLERFIIFKETYPIQN